MLISMWGFFSLSQSRMGRSTMGHPPWGMNGEKLQEFKQINWVNMTTYIDVNPIFLFINSK